MKALGPGAADLRVELLDLKVELLEEQIWQLAMDSYQ